MDFMNPSFIAAPTIVETRDLATEKDVHRSSFPKSIRYSSSRIFPSCNITMPAARWLAIYRSTDSILPSTSNSVGSVCLGPVFLVPSPLQLYGKAQAHPSSERLCCAAH